MCAATSPPSLIDGTATSCTTPRPGRIIAAGSSVTTGQPLAVIRWHAAVHALEARQLPCSSSQSIFASPPASPTPASPCGSGEPRQPDARNIALVTDAIAAANGGRAPKERT